MSSVTTTIRLFVAGELPGEVKAALNDISHQLAGQLGTTARAVRWVRPEAIHLTLQFLGDVPVGMQPLLKEAVARGCIGHDPIDLSLGGLGVFPNLKRPRVLWLGLSGEDADMPALSALQAAISRELSEIGFEPDKEFRPHLTLGRVREGASRDEIGAITRVLTSTDGHPTSAIAFTLHDVSLIKSELRPSGSVYTRVITIPL